MVDEKVLFFKVVSCHEQKSKDNSIYIFCKNKIMINNNVIILIF